MDTKQGLEIAPEIGSGWLWIEELAAELALREITTVDVTVDALVAVPYGGRPIGELDDEDLIDAASRFERFRTSARG